MSLLAIPLTTLALLTIVSGDDKKILPTVRTRVDSPLFVERVAGFDPARVNVRCVSHQARTIVRAVAAAGGLVIVEIPEELGGTVASVSLRAVHPEEAIETIVGALGYLTRVEDNRVYIERPPSTNDSTSREWYIDKATSRFEQFLAFDGDHPDAASAWLELACLREEQGNFEGTIEALTALREWNPKSPMAIDALVEIGRIQFQQGEFDDAIATLVEVVDKHAVNPACGRAYAYLGRCRLATDSVEMARRYFKIGIDRFPNSPGSVSSRIWNIDILRRMGDVETAWTEVASVEEMYLTRPQSAELLEVRSNLEASTGHYQEAEQGWLALAYAERNPIARVKFLTEALHAARKGGDRLSELMLLATLHPGERHERVGKWLVEQGLPEAALRFSPSDPAIMLDAALARAAGGEIDRAKALLASTPITIDTAYVRKLVQAEIALRSGHPEDVPQILLAAVEASSDKTFVLNALEVLSRAYVLTGDLGLAEQAMRGIVPKEESR